MRSEMKIINRLLVVIFVCGVVLFIFPPHPTYYSDQAFMSVFAGGYIDGRFDEEIAAFESQSKLSVSNSNDYVKDRVLIVSEKPYDKFVFICSISPEYGASKGGAWVMYRDGNCERIENWHYLIDNANDLKFYNINIQRR